MRGSISVQRAVAAVSLAAALVAVGAGCETKSFLDPSEVGRYEKTPKAVPILDKLVIGVEADEVQFPNAREVNNDDLKVTATDYRVGPGDLIQVTIQDLSSTGLQQLETKQVSESGKISLPYISQLPVTGLTEPEIEAAVIKAYADAQILTNATVSVAVVSSQNKQYTISGSINLPAAYPLPRADYRLLDALANAHGVTSEQGIDWIYVIRRKDEATTGNGSTTAPAAQPLVDPLAPQSRTSGERPTPLFLMAQAQPAKPMTADEARRQANDLANQLNRGGSIDPLAATPSTAPGRPAGMNPAGTNDRVIQIEGAGTRPADGSAPRVTSIPPTASVSPSVAQPPVTDATPFTGPGSNEDPTGTQPMATASGGFSGFTAPNEPTDREIIRVPYPALRDGALKYNVVVHPQDLIYIPSPGVGEYYMAGHIARPGVYSLTARKITLKQAVASAGMLDQLAIPARTDIVRRTSANQEVFVRVDLERIASGLEPDIFLKPNDYVQVGTNAGAPFLAALRNAFRITYGFGFLYDRNYGPRNNGN